MARVNYRQTAPSTSSGPRGLHAWLADRPQMPYIIPLFAYLILMAPATFPDLAGIPFKSLWHTWHPFVYAAKSIVAGLLIWYFWPWYTRVRWSRLGLGALVGLAGTPIWIAIHYACISTGFWHATPPDELYNPDLMLAAQWQRWLFLCVRVAGPTLVVPFMEELFFRDFLARALVRGARFDDVPVGTFTWFSLLGTSALFGLNHGSMWPAGVIYGLMMGVLLLRTRSLGACIVAHAVTNWSLYLYVIYTGDWQFM